MDENGMSSSQTQPGVQSQPIPATSASGGMLTQDIIAAAVKAAMQATLGLTVSATTSIAPPKFPENFRADPARGWRSFTSEWDSYVICSKLDAQADDIQLHTFLTAIGKEGRLLYDGFNFGESESKNDLQTVLKKFKEFSMGTQTEISLRAEFYRRVQHENETTSAYISELFRLSENCNFKDRDEMVRDKIALGIKDDNLRERLFRQHKLDLNKAITMCRADETAKAQTRSLRENPIDYLSEGAVNSIITKPKSSKQSKKTSQQTSQKLAVDCSYCGRKHEPNRTLCPASGKICGKCSKKGHFAVKCNSTAKPRGRNQNNERQNNGQQHSVRQVETMEPSEGDFEAFAVSTKVTGGAIYTWLNVEGKPIKFQVDCGATISVISSNNVPPHKELEPCKKKLIMYNKSVVIPEGKVRLDIINPANQQKYSIGFVVLPSDLKLQPILGNKTSQFMNLITVNEENIVDKCPTVFAIDSVVPNNGFQSQNSMLDCNDLKTCMSNGEMSNVSNGEMSNGEMSNVSNDQMSKVKQGVSMSNSSNSHGYDVAMSNVNQQGSNQNMPVQNCQNTVDEKSLSNELSLRQKIVSQYQMYLIVNLVNFLVSLTSQWTVQYRHT